MPCRVGMTTDLEGRKAHWKSKYTTLSDWKILHKCSSKDEAQKKEKEEAGKRKCDYHTGGDGPERATWYVYYFKHNGY